MASRTLAMIGKRSAATAAPTARRLLSQEQRSPRSSLSSSPSSPSSPPPPPASAAALIIGDEILSGKIRDSNSHVLAQALFKHGIDLVRMETVRDDIEHIVESVKRLSNLVGPQGCVFTSGGIGCTHDDVTYEAIAKAFQRELVVHEPTRQAMTSFYDSKNRSVNSARLRMACLPHPCRVIKTAGLWVPLAVVENVFILPGVPHLFKQMVESALLTDEYIPRGRAIFREMLELKCGEGDIADMLSALQSQYPAVAIGSYPKMVPPEMSDTDESIASVQLCFTSREQTALKEVLKLVVEQLSERQIVHHPSAVTECVESKSDIEAPEISHS